MVREIEPEGLPSIIASHARSSDLGIKGVPNYTEAREQFPRALRRVASGGFWVPRQLLSRFVDSILDASQPQHIGQLAFHSLTSPQLHGHWLVTNSIGAGYSKFRTVVGHGSCMG
jgi:hypothetical protein